MARRRSHGRNINGMLVLDKPIGVSSNSALQTVRKLFGAAKAGHTGSLDPLATGMLPICFGEATKVCSYLLDADKTYRMRAKLGQQTDTADAEGEVTAELDASGITQEALEAVLPQFRGEIEQIPPMYSALHHEGKRLYELAREGVEVEREARPVTIYKLELISFEHTGDGVFAELDVQCSKGTYIRTLAEDIASALDNLAHLTMLRRTIVGCYTESRMVTMEQLEAAKAEDFSALMALLNPVEETIAHWPAVDLEPDMAAFVKAGNPVLVPSAPRDGLVRLREVDPERFIGIGEIDAEGMVAPKRLIRCA